jgi:hypothetical protein
VTWVASWPPARGDRDLDSHVRAEIARRYRRCLQATHGRSQLRERAVQIPEISIAPGIVLIRPWERERRPGAGDVSPRRGACASQKRVQSRAYAPPQCPPTRSPPITRDTNTTVPAAHTLTRVGGAKPPRRAPASTQRQETGNEAHHCGDSRLHTFTIHLARRCPGTAAIRKRPRTRRHARGREDGRACS